MKLDFGSGHNPKKGYKKGDITKSPFIDFVIDPNSYKVDCKNNMFDEVLLRNTIHHIKDLPILFKELKRILTKNGKVVIVEPSKEAYKANVCLDVLWYRYIMPRYEIWISPEYRNIVEYAKTEFDVKSIKQQNEKDIIILTKR